MEGPEGESHEDFQDTALGQEARPDERPVYPGVRKPVNKETQVAAVEAIARLYNTAEFKAVRAYIGVLTGDAVEKAIKTAENPEIMRGRAQALMELAEFINNAPQVERRLENNRNGTAQNKGRRNP